MDLKDIGEALRAERERQGLSIEDVSERTKISRRNLEAIEAGRQDELPHLVYTRGFVKNYARLLSLDADKLGLALTLVYGDSEPCEDLPGASQPDVPLTVRTSALRKAWTAAMALFVLAAVGAGGYFLLGELPPKPTPDQVAKEAKGGGPSEQAKTEPPKVLQDTRAGSESKSGPGAKSVLDPAPRAEAPAGPAAPASSVEPSGPTTAAAPAAPKAAAPQPGGKAPAASFGATAKSDPSSDKPEPMNVATRPDQPAAAGAQAAPAPTQPAKARTEYGAEAKGANMVEIMATESCWLRVLTDGEARTREYNLKPGDSVKLPFSKILMVKLGNAGGVNVTYNGSPYTTNAQSGQVKTISFP
jgi:cytoskeleton protein RodZ